MCGYQKTLRVGAAVGPSPKRSVRRHSDALNIPRSSLQWTLQYDLYFHPFKSHIVQNCQAVILLQEVYLVSNFFFSTFPNENPGVIRHLKMSDEAHFELSGCVNTQRMRYWSEANPHKVGVKQIQSESNSVV